MSIFIPVTTDAESKSFESRQTLSLVVTNRYRKADAKEVKIDSSNI